MYLQLTRYEKAQSSCKRDTKSKSHPGMKLAPVRVFSCKHPLTVNSNFLSPRKPKKWATCTMTILTTRTRIHFVFSFIFKFANASEVYTTKAVICIRKQYPEGFWKYTVNDSIVQMAYWLLRCKLVKVN